MRKPTAGPILGLGGPYYHDSSACLVDADGRIDALVEEERLVRRKRNRWSRSCARAAAACLAHAGIRLADVAEVAVAWNPGWPAPAAQVDDPDIIRDLLDPAWFGGFSPPRLTIVDHHETHAASAFYLSGLDDAAVLVVDGAGDGKATSLYRGDANGLTLLDARPYTQSLGWFYESAAEHIGLGEGGEGAGKLMGLAAYGTPRFALEFVRDDPSLGYVIDLSAYGLTASADHEDSTYFGRLKRAYAAAFTAAGVPQQRAARRLESNTGRVVRDLNLDAKHADLAASAQAVLERSLLALARNALHATGSDAICLAGGVALNCSANGRLYRQSGARQFFVQPVAHDAGCAVGAALVCARRDGRPAPERLTTTALGPAYSDAAIGETLAFLQLPAEYLGDGIVERTARALAGGAIVAWFQGRAEAGPRALGQRSILADPRDVGVRDRINRDIKRRELWRPLAPSLLAADAGRFFDHTGQAEFMVVAHPSTAAARATIPAVIHVDGSLRPQVVEPAALPQFARLLSEFGRLTGVAALLNTSFNGEDEPIVCSPADALKMFFSTPLDGLALGGFWIEKAPAATRTTP